MNLQELLVYIEELGFKNSMFGYDKNEVDDELDKICDMVEALVKEKDEEIDRLKKQPGGSDFSVENKAPGQEPQADAGEAAKDQAEEASKEVAGISAETGEDLRSQIQALNEQLKETEARQKAAEEKYQAAQAVRQEAEARARELEGQLKDAQEQLKEARSRLADGQTANPAQPAEVTGENAKPASAGGPASTDEAYQTYLRNADLLCKQLSVLEEREKTIVDKANAEAEGILAEAKQKAEEAVAARKEEKESLLADIERLKEARRETEKAEQGKIDRLTAEKTRLVEEIRQAAEKTQDFLKELEG